MTVPYPVHYRFRGKRLRHLNRREYTALFQVKPKKDDPDTELIRAGRNAVKRFDLGKGHDLEASHTQMACLVQPVLLCSGQQPRNPGPEPPKGTKTHRHWKVKADKFARYYLTMHRPEEDLYDEHSVNEYKYDYDALQDWVNHLIDRAANHDDILAWFRL